MDAKQLQQADLMLKNFEAEVNVRKEVSRLTRSYLDPMWIKSPISLPQAQSGPLSIRYRLVTDSTPIIGTRSAFVRGIKPTMMKLKEPLTVHELVDRDHGVWMTDLPEELFQIAEVLMINPPSGNVLIGGLGLGILARFVAMNPSVKHVTVIERSQDVINLCAFDHPNVKIICDDIANAILVQPRHQHYLLDTWQMTSEGAWWSTILPLKRSIRQRFGGRSATPKIWCWAEDIMIGQVAVRLATLTPERWHWYYNHLPVPMSVPEAISFCRDVGTAAWEKKYGAIVDRNIEKIKRESV